jgi:hypothetical protein
MDNPSLRVTEEQIAAAQLRLALDEKLGRPTPEWVRRIAATTGVESRELQHPSPDPEANPVAARMSRSEDLTQSMDEAREEMAAQTRPAVPARPQVAPPPLNALSPIQNPLTAVMTAKSPEDYAALQRLVKHFQSLPPDQNPVAIALNKLGNMHFAWFAFLGTNQLGMITAYDGEFEAYINNFIDNIGDVFNALLTHIVSAPPLPVQTYRQEFIAYIRTIDCRCVGTFYSAYPDLTVGDIDMASAVPESKLPQQNRPTRKPS